LASVVDIEWPEGDEAVSSEMATAIDQLLTLDPDQRPGIDEVQKMELFVNVDWKDLLKQKAPFIPEPTSGTDTAYFEGTLSKIKNYMFANYRFINYSSKYTATLDCIQL